MKKAGMLVAIVAAMVLALCLVGCSSSGDASSEESQKPQEPKTAAIGESVPVATKYGDLEVAVDGFKIVSSLDPTFPNELADGQTIGLALLTVKNVSYDMKTTTTNTQGDPVSIVPDVYTADADGVTMTAMSSSTDYGGYKGAAGGYYFTKIGQTNKVALFYAVDPKLSSVTVHAGDYEVPVTVEAEQG